MGKLLVPVLLISQYGKCWELLLVDESMNREWAVRISSEQLALV